MLMENGKLPAGDMPEVRWATVSSNLATSLSSEPPAASSVALSVENLLLSDDFEGPK